MNEQFPIAEPIPAVAEQLPEEAALTTPDVYVPLEGMPPQFEDELPPQEEEPLVTPMDEEQLLETEELMSMATGSSMKLGGFWTPTIFDDAAKQVIESVRLEEESVRSATLIEALSSPELSVSARLKLADALANRTRADMNMVERSAMTTLAEQDAAMRPSDEAMFAVTSAMAGVENVPTKLVPEYGAGVGMDDSNDLTNSGYFIGNLIRQRRDSALEEEGASDVLGQVIPWKQQLLMGELARVSGVSTDFTEDGSFANEALLTGASTFAAGTTMRRIAEQLELDAMDAGLIPKLNGELAEGSDEAKAAFRKKVQDILGVLKNNSGVFSDVNHSTTAYVLENMFPFFTTDSYANEDFNKAQESSALDALFERKRVLTARLAAYGSQIPEDVGPSLERELAAIDAQLKAGQLAQFRPTFAPGGKVTFNEFAANFASMDDILLTPDLLRLARGGYRLLKNRVVRAISAAPAVTANAAVEGLAGGVPSRILAGSDPRDLLDSVLPSVAERNWTSTNISAGTALEEADEILAARLDSIANRIILTDGERGAALSKLNVFLGSNTTARPAALNLGSSTITPVRTAAGEDGLAIAGVFGKNEVDAFDSVEDAAKAAVSLFGSKAPVRILTLDPSEGGKLVKARANEIGGKYYFSVATEVPYERVVDFNSGLIFGDKAITPGITNKAWWSLKAGTFNPLGYKSSVFDKFWSIAQNAAFDRERSMKRLMLTRFEEAAKMAGGKQYELERLLTGIETKRKVTRSVLEDIAMREGFALTDELITATHLYRKGTDLLYQIADRYAVNQFMREGVEEVWSGTRRLGFGLRVADTKATQVVKNAETGVKETLDRAQLKALTDQGAVLMRMKNTDELVLVSGKATVRPISSGGVIKYIPNYIPKVVSAPYIVFGTSSTGTRIILGTASNSSDAAKLVKQLEVEQKLPTSDLGGYKIGFGFDKSMRGVGEAGIIADSAVENLGGLVFGERNGRKLINGSPETMASTHLDPLAAAIRAADAVSYTVTKGDMLAQMSERILNNIKLLTGRTFNRLDEETIDQLREMGNPDGIADRAMAVLAQSNVTAGMPDALTSIGETLFVNLERAFAKAYEKTGVRLLKGAAEWAGDKAVAGGYSPLNAAMRLSHVASVSTAFTTQMALQMAQPLLLAGLSPTGMTKAFAVQALLATTFSARKFGINSKRVQAISKAIGLEKDELTKLIRAMEDRGVYDAVEVDTRMRSQAQQHALLVATQKLSGGMKPSASGVLRRRAVKLGNATKTAGEGVMRGAEATFIFSEKLNQQITFMTLYFADKSKGVANLASRKYLDDLSGRTREVTGAMTPENSFGFQRGLFKAMTQFISFPWKMTKLVLPEFAGGNRTLAPAQKAGIVAGQAMLYGLSGMPGGDWALSKLNDMVMSNAPVDPLERNAFEQAYFSEPVQAALNGLIMETMINGVLRNISGDDETSLEISERFAALGGTSFAVSAFMEPFLNKDLKDPVELFFAIPGAKATQVYELIKDVGTLALADWNDVKGIDFETRWEHLRKKGAATLIAQYRREYVLAAHDAMDGHVLGGGNVSQESMTDFERNAFRLFSIDTSDKAAYYKLRDQYRDIRAGASEGTITDEVNEYVTKYWDDLLNHNRLNNEAALPDDKIRLLQEEWVETQNYLATVIFEDDEQMLDKVKEGIAKKVLDAMARVESGEASTAEAQLLGPILTKMTEGVLKGDTELTANRLMHSAALSPEQKAMVIDTYRNYIEDKGEE